MRHAPDVHSLSYYLDLPEWHDQAACKGADTRDFFPEHGQGVARSYQAKALCNTCPVQTDCLNYAIENNERHGIWGGMSFRQRRTHAQQQQQEATA